MCTRHLDGLNLSSIPTGLRDWPVARQLYVGLVSVATLRRFHDSGGCLWLSGGADRTLSWNRFDSLSIADFPPSILSLYVNASVDHRWEALTRLSLCLSCRMMVGCGLDALPDQLGTKLSGLHGLYASLEAQAGGPKATSPLMYCVCGRSVAFNNIQAMAPGSLPPALVHL